MKYNIAYIHNEYPAGGAEKVSFDIAKWMFEKGHTNFMFVKKLAKEKLTESDKEVFRFIELGDADIYNISAGQFISDKLRENGVQIFIVPIVTFRWLGYVRENSGAKIIWTHHNIPMWKEIEAFERRGHLARTSGSVVKKLKWFLLRYPRYKVFKIPRRRAIWMNRTAYNNSDMMVVLCEGYKEEMARLLNLDPDNNRIEFVHNFLEQRQYPFIEKKKQLLSIGRFSYADKRLDRLVDIWEKIHNDFPEWSLVMVGDGPERENIKKRVETRKLPRVEFHGYTKNSGQYYAESPIVCLTSNFEGWPMVIAEAQQAGTVPVCFDCAAGVREQLSPEGENGVLVTPFDMEEYADKLSALMRDEERLEHMSASVREKAKTYRREDSCQKWEMLFGKLLEK